MCIIAAMMNYDNLAKLLQSSNHFQSMLTFHCSLGSHESCNRPQIERGDFNKSIVAIRYTLFWLCILVSKFAFSYWLQVLQNLWTKSWIVLVHFSIVKTWSFSEPLFHHVYSRQGFHLGDLVWDSKHLLCGPCTDQAFNCTNKGDPQCKKCHDQMAWIFSKWCTSSLSN